MPDKEWVLYNVQRIRHYSLQYLLFPAADFQGVLRGISNRKTLSMQPRRRQEDDTTPYGISRIREILPAAQKVQIRNGVLLRDQQENYRAIFASQSESM